MRRQPSRFPRRLVAVAFAAAVMVTAFAQPTLGTPADTRPQAGTLAGAPCPDGSSTRNYNVTALPIPISYNHWGDFDPKGRLFVPEENLDPMLDDVSAKLARAGLRDLAEPVVAMRDALRSNDVAAATLAAEALAQAAASDEMSAPPRGRFDTSDLVQPLVVRAYLGECVTITLRNLMPESASIHVNTLRTVAGAGAAVGLQAPDLTERGQTRVYRMYIPNHANMEGAHFLSSHADPRDQIRHGLFGAVVGEPVGSAWLSTKDGETPAPTGLEAIIVRDGPAGSATGADFREFVKIYHDEIELFNWTLAGFPSISPYGEYGPGTKGLNLRTEPFMDRFKYHDALGPGTTLEPGTNELARNHDKSQSYGSYTYGDPATWIQRSYLSDPVKFRLMNAGPGQYHMHHLHGGGIRWKSTPLAEASEFAMGLTKDHPNQASASQRLDVQNVGPGESYNLEPEGGSGGIQQAAGDFLYHCHIAEHYLAGMWGIWRVYNTIQPDLAELPDRAGRHKLAVSSDALVGRTVLNGTLTLTPSNVDEWVEAQLPPRGVPLEEDASVWNWAVTTTQSGAPVYFGEPETTFVWPNYPADAPGRQAAEAMPDRRPEIGFDPNTGKVAYPLMRPHLGARPPFAPGHGPAPFLFGEATQANPDGLCPAGARNLKYDVVALQSKVKYNKFDTDSKGSVFARVEDRAAIENGSVNPTSIILRANAGDCVDVSLVNVLNEKSTTEQEEGIHAKTNIHIHLVQFDPQASDGVVAGYNYETTIRRLSTTKLAEDPSAVLTTKISTAPDSVTLVDGKSVIGVDNIAPFFDATGAPKLGSTVGLSLGLTSIEQAKITAVEATTGGAGKLTLDRALAKTHLGGEFIGYEFVNYRWFPDVELGIVYFHDHIDGIKTWRHGLFGSLLVEPRESRWLDPVRVNDSAPDSPIAHVVDVKPGDGSKPYREIVLHFSDRACVNNPNVNDCLSATTPLMPDLIREPAAFNLRSEPLHRRNVQDPLWNSAKYSKNDAATVGVDDRNVQHGDPATDILQAYPGDRVVIRFLYSGASMSRAVGTFAVTGHRFQQEQFLENGRTTDTIDVSVSSQHNLELECGAGGCLKQPGDYMYWMTQPEYLERGAWGLIRVLPPPTPGNEPIRLLDPNVTPTAGTFPASTGLVQEGGNTRHYEVVAVETLIANNPSQGITSTIKHFIPLEQVTADVGLPIATPPDPLVIRARPGEIVEVSLTNRMTSGRVGINAGMLSAGPDGSGFNLGRNAGGRTIGLNEQITYRWYADREVGAVDLVSLADPVDDAKRGLTGALIVEPLGSRFSNATGSASDILLPNGQNAREHVLLFATDDAQFESSTMPYLVDVRGLSLVNYATEPFSRRAGAVVDDRGVLPNSLGGTSLHTCQIDNADCLGHQTDVRAPAVPFAASGLAPWTPIIEARFGDPLVIRALGASGDQLQVFHLDGHAFATDPEMDDCKLVLGTCRSNVVSSVSLGARGVRNVWIPSAGVGGPGDYLYRNGRDAFYEAGQWGLLRVNAPPLTPESLEDAARDALFARTGLVLPAIPTLPQP